MLINKKIIISIYNKIRFKIYKIKIILRINKNLQIKTNNKKKINKKYIMIKIISIIKISQIIKSKLRNYNKIFMIINLQKKMKSLVWIKMNKEVKIKIYLLHH